MFATRPDSSRHVDMTSANFVRLLMYADSIESTSSLGTGTNSLGDASAAAAASMAGRNPLSYHCWSSYPNGCTTILNL